MTKPILSLRDLAWRVGVPKESLRTLAGDIRHDHRSHYSEFPIRIGKGKFRTIRPPRDELMSVQRKIAKRILEPMGFAEAAHGGVPGRSPTTNASVHRGQPVLVALDVKGFFDNVDHRRIYRMFRQEHGCGHDVARLLTRLTTLKGALPQGAATSPALANVFMTKAVDEALEPAVRALELRYSRFVDDLAFSGREPQAVIAHAARLLSACGLQVNKKKLHICRRAAPQVVTGLLVNDLERVTIPRKQRDAVRAAIHQLAQGNLAQPAFDKALRSIKGRIAHVERFHGGDGRRLRRYLETVLTQRAARI
jgi:RNA-directed DNA polymerase